MGLHAHGVRGRRGAVLFIRMSIGFAGQGAEPGRHVDEDRENVGADRDSEAVTVWPLPDRVALGCRLQNRSSSLQRLLPVTEELSEASNGFRIAPQK